MDLGRIIERVAAHRPRLVTPSNRGFHAATAVVLSATPDPALVIIRRASRDGDPWSGHAALPGGKREDQDPDLVTTARRETREEVGLDLGEPVGRLDDVGGRVHMGVVSPHVFVVDRLLPLRPDPVEVAAAHWVPLRILIDPDRQVRHPHRRVGPWPAWSYATGMPPPHDELIIWGLTHRILSSFIDTTDLT
jgi:8-oxo-dGTP pyrophosphatase MutT (NUDIX family)